MLRNAFGSVWIFLDFNFMTLSFAAERNFDAQLSRHVFLNLLSHAASAHQQPSTAGGLGV